MTTLVNDLNSFAETRIVNLRIEGQEIKELRLAQKVILSRCAQALNQNKHILVQAPSGCGKTLAYALVASYITEKSNGKALIVCPTKDLQKQVSTTCRALGLNFIEIYGSEEYVCPVRNKLLKSDAPVITLLCKHLEKCYYREKGECDYFRVHGLAKEFSLLITNYNKYIESWDVLKGKGKFNLIIFDEAHNLEQIAEQSSIVGISLKELEYTKKVFQDFVNKNYKQIREIIPILKDLNFYFLHDLDFDNIDIIRVGGKFEELIKIFKNWKFNDSEEDMGEKDLQELTNKCKNLINALERFSIIETFTIHRPENMHMLKLRESLIKFIIAESELRDKYRFKKRFKGEHLEIIGEPQIREMIHYILRESTKIQCHVSATLGNLYDYAERIGALKHGFITCEITDYPFNIEKRILLGLTDGPSMHKYKKDEHDYYWKEKKEVANKILEKILLKWPGNTLVFFRSREEAGEAYEFLSRNALLEPRLVFKKYFETGAERREIIEYFKKKKGSVLLGFGKMDQGLDLPGESLTLIVVYSSPFIHRTHQMERDIQRYKSSRVAFEKVDLDVAARRLSQLIGRLIRTSDDFGVVVVIDRRFYTRFYRWMKGRKMLPHDVNFKFFSLEHTCEILEKYWKKMINKSYSEYVGLEEKKAITTLKDFIT